MAWVMRAVEEYWDEKKKRRRNNIVSGRMIDRQVEEREMITLVRGGGVEIMLGKVWIYNHTRADHESVYTQVAQECEHTRLSRCFTLIAASLVSLSSCLI